jgi:hypothetical protein
MATPILKIDKALGACRREGKPPFFRPPGLLGWHTKPFCAPYGGRNGADDQCYASLSFSLRQAARVGNTVMSTIDDSFIGGHGKSCAHLAVLPQNHCQL